jgi:Flp pilus assembly protein TadG
MTRKREKSESGAALVEFALLLPVFMALVLGMFSGGVIYNQKMDLTHATREGARYGAAIDKKQTFANGASWASNVRDLVVARSGGDLTAGSGTTAGVTTDGVCVAMVTGSPAAVVLPTASYSTSGSTCFTDTSGDTSTRVQVSARRAGKLEVLFFTRVMTLTANATARYEGP